MEFLRWKVWLCVALSVSILAVLTPTASGQTASGQTDPPEEVIIGVGNTDVSCYTCDNVPDNDECNGVNLGENGTLVQCPYERSNCYSILKMNSAGDGYTTQKGCMDFDECYDKFYELIADPVKGGNCMRLGIMGHDPPPGDIECFFCCFSYEGKSQDKCNTHMGTAMLALPVPNNWDPAVDKWEGHEPVESTAEPDVTDGGDGGARPLAAVIGVNVLILLALAA